MKFTILEPNPVNQAGHRIAIDYITGNLLLLSLINGYMLLANADKDNHATEEYRTFMIRMQVGLSISAYQEID